MIGMQAGNPSKERVEMESIYKAMGWQGGTIHQIIAEIKRLQSVENAAIDFAEEVALADSIGQIKKCNKGIAEKGRTLNALVKQ